jgi:predicted transcriptional regulator YheO
MKVLEPAVDGIAVTFGPLREAGLRHLENVEHSVVKIAKGHVTGGTVGDTISRPGPEPYKGIQDKDCDQSFSVTKGGGTPESHYYPPLRVRRA